MWSRDIQTFRQRSYSTMADAFKGPDYACAIERPSSWLRRVESVFGVVVICSLGLLIGYSLAWMI